ncbi:metallophosphoesterase [uncultured Selenomonas sp.]|uniref:metallophosphoesterase family protein n=1 Tax=uncultured Selenomonas sp. TaxID=159275 RepID=UPI0028EBA431|nr:metallophosphoesterase [uncultured Selenomonas sp.]
MTRRHFLQTALQSILTMGLGGLFSSRAAAAADGIRHLRQIITAQPSSTRMIQWDASTLLRGVHVELRSGRDGHSTAFVPSYTHFTIDDTEQFVYHAEIPLPAGGGAYRVTHAAGASDWVPLSAPHAVRTPVRALLFSDSQCGEDYSVWNDLYQAAWRRHSDADFAALVGDLTDNGESTWHWDSFFAAMEGNPSPLARTPHVPVLGNHEYYSLAWTDTLPLRYLKTFALPENGSTAFRGHYYSFDLGAAHVIVLDTQFLECGARGAALNEEQLAWLKRDAAASSAPWKIVLMHKDILAYGEYQTVQETQHGISDVGRIFMGTFDACGIDLVVTGHVHAYRRRQIRVGQTDAQGTLYLLGGPGGDEYFDVPPEPYDLAASANPAPSNYLYLEADAHHLYITCEALDGTVIDTVEQQK